MLNSLLDLVNGVTEAVHTFFAFIFWLISNMTDIFRSLVEMLASAASVVEEAARTAVRVISGLVEVISSLYVKTLCHWDQLLTNALPLMQGTAQSVYSVVHSVFTGFNLVTRGAVSMFSVAVSGVSQAVGICSAMTSGFVGVASFIWATLVSITTSFAEVSTRIFSTLSNVLSSVFHSGEQKQSQSSTISNIIFSIFPSEEEKESEWTIMSYITVPVVTIALAVLVLIFLTVWLYRSRHWLMDMQQVFQNCFMVAQPYINPAHPHINPVHPQAQPQRDDDVAANDGRPGSAVEGERVAVDSAAQGAGGCGGERQRRRSNSPNLPRESQPPSVSRSSSQSAGSVRTRQQGQGDEADTGSQSPSPPQAQRVNEDTGMRQRRERRDSSPNLSRVRGQPPSMRRGSSPSVGGRGRQPDQGNQAGTNRPSPPRPAALLDNHAYGHVRQRRQHNDTNLSRETLPQYQRSSPSGVPFQQSVASQYYQARPPPTPHQPSQLNLSRAGLLPLPGGGVTWPTNLYYQTGVYGPSPTPLTANAGMYRAAQAMDGYGNVYRVDDITSQHYLQGMHRHTGVHVYGPLSPPLTGNAGVYHSPQMAGGHLSNHPNLSRGTLQSYSPQPGGYVPSQRVGDMTRLTHQAGVHRPSPPPSPSPSSPSSPPASPEEEDPDRLCIVCMDSKREVLLRPCCHYCVCQVCSRRLHGLCPVCRAQFTSSEVLHIFL